jgi:hypothetical protein
MFDRMPRVTSVTSRQSGQVSVAYARLFSTVGRRYRGRYNRNIASSTARSYLPDYFCRDLLGFITVKSIDHSKWLQLAAGQ